MSKTVAGNKRGRSEEETQDGNRSLLYIFSLPDQAENAIAPPAEDRGVIMARYTYPVWANVGRVTTVLPGETAAGTGIVANINNVPLEWYDPANNTGLLDRAMISMYKQDPSRIPVGGIPRVNGENALITFASPGNPYLLLLRDDTCRDHFLTFARADFQVRFQNDASAAGFVYSFVRVLSVSNHVG
jgi:hypothetical protein